LSKVIVISFFTVICIVIISMPVIWVFI